MNAVRIHAYGGPEVLQYEEAPQPRPRRGEVLVQVHAVAVNPVDWKVREGQLKERVQYQMPLILGWDVSGVVEAVGPGVKRLKMGDPVYSRPDIARDGAYAEYVVIKESLVAHKPASFDHVHAAALPLSAMTAWQALFDAAQLTSGQRVLIHAAAGGVGHYAVQLAKWKHAHVIGTASSENQAFLRDLGADETIDYRKAPFEDQVSDVDVVLDTLGGDVQTRSWKVLKPGGILVSIVHPPSAEQAASHGVRQAYLFMQPKLEQLDQIASLAEAGKLQSVVETVLPLAQARKAHEVSQAGHTRGKIVLRVVEI
jgi:NADPH:quinone reductase-like Zn-dependent oxidoreductase